MFAAAGLIYSLINIALAALGVFALVDAAIRPTQAYPAIGRLSKVQWVGILAAGLVAQLLFPVIGGGVLGLVGFPTVGSLGMLAVAGIIAAIVYLVDTRQKLIQISRGSRW